MIHLDIHSEGLAAWLLYAVVGGYFALELTVIAYIIYLI